MFCCFVYIVYRFGYHSAQNAKAIIEEKLQNLSSIASNKTNSSQSDEMISAQIAINTQFEATTNIDASLDHTIFTQIDRNKISFIPIPFTK